MPKRPYSDLEKVTLVLGSMQEGVVITDYCNYHRISRSAFYTWRKAILKQLATGLSQKQPAHLKV
jgi:transposase-like protein